MCAASESSWDKYINTFLEEALLSDQLNKTSVQKIKTRICSRMKLPKIPRDSVILSHVLEQRGELEAMHGDEPVNSLIKALIKKPTRTLSGVAPVAIMTPPAPCPHGKCRYCPGGPDIQTPQSYTGREPAALRGANYGFDPYRQVEARIQQYREIGHVTDKVDLIIMGGTFPAREADFQARFVQRALDALNSRPSNSLHQAKLLNQEADCRCIGLTLETRPDWAKIPQANMMLALGGTRVELGIQTLDNETLEAMNRGHTVEDSIEATRILKDSGLKVCYHLMPDLPGSDPDSDLETFRTVFRDPDFRPDMLKIYPTLVIEGTEIFEMLQCGDYRPYSLDQMIETIAKAKNEIPEWIRIQRIQRDIPAGLIFEGVKKSNLRQLVKEKMEQRGMDCKCIRCREAGRAGTDPDVSERSIEVKAYGASQGTEVFISSKADGWLLGYVRLRKPSTRAHRPEIGGQSAIIRELRVVGTSLSIGSGNGAGTPPVRAIQHQGIGTELMKRAEEYAGEEWDSRSILVNSGIGVRNYYGKLGYKLKGVYMTKRLNQE